MLGRSNSRGTRGRSLGSVLATVISLLVFMGQADAHIILNDAEDSPGVQHWVAGIASLAAGECFVPIEAEAGDLEVVYLNVAIDFNNDGNYAVYPGSDGPQEEWIIQNVPIHVLPNPAPAHYHSAFFDLTDSGAQNGSFDADFWVSDVVLGAVSPGAGDVTIASLPMETFDRDLLSPPNADGPSGAPGGNDRLVGAGNEGADGDRRGAGEGATRKLPVLKKQGVNQCFITSVAMSMKWLEDEYPDMFKGDLPESIDDLLAAMRATDEWQTHSIIRWGHLDEWKKTIFGDYSANVVVHEWNGTDDAYTWMKTEFDNGQDVEMSMQYGAGPAGHTVIITGWVEKDNKKYVKAVDPAEPTKNDKQLDKNIEIDGTDTSYPGNTSIREINAESPKPKDPHATVPGGETSVGIGVGGTIPAIPADFFAPGSDPFVGTLLLEGNPFDPPAMGNTSTVVRRSGAPIPPTDPVGSEGTVEIQIITLNLQAIEPVIITMNGGQDPQQWDVSVDLSEVAAPVGSLTATKTHENGGTFDTALNVQPRFTFTQVSDPGQVRVLDTGLENLPPIAFNSTGTPFVHVVHPDLDILAPWDGTFVPGVEEVVPGDPSSQQTRPTVQDDPEAPATHVVESSTPPTTKPIPTVSEWGMMVMVVLLLAAGTIVMGRRRRPAAR